MVHQEKLQGLMRAKTISLCDERQGSLVKRLRLRPLTPATRVRFPHESPNIFSLSALEKPMRDEVRNIEPERVLALRKCFGETFLAKSGEHGTNEVGVRAIKSEAFGRFPHESPNIFSLSA